MYVRMYVCMYVWGGGIAEETALLYPVGKRTYGKHTENAKEIAEETLNDNKNKYVRMYVCMYVCVRERECVCVCGVYIYTHTNLLLSTLIR